MSRPFWIAAFSGTIAAAAVINQLMLTKQEAGVIVAVLVWSLTALALIDIFLVGPPSGPTERNP